MGKRIFGDIGIAILFTIINEFLHAVLYDVFSPPRDMGEMASFIGNVLCMLVLIFVLYRRYQKNGMSILYGFLLGIFLFLSIHLIQYPTVQNVYIGLYKLVMAIILPIIFVNILAKKIKGKE